VMTAQMRDRFFWPEALVEMRKLLMNVEDRVRKQHGHEVGVWIENFGTVATGEEEETSELQKLTAPFGSIEWMQENQEMAERYFKEIFLALKKNGLIKPKEFKMVAAPRGSNTNLFTINVKFRAVTPINPNDPAANGRLAYAVAEEFKNSPYFDPEGTKLSTDMEEPEQVTQRANAFRFNMVLKLRNEMQM